MELVDYDKVGRVGQVERRSPSARRRAWKGDAQPRLQPQVRELRRTAHGLTEHDMTDGEFLCYHMSIDRRPTSIFLTFSVSPQLVNW